MLVRSVAVAVGSSLGRTLACTDCSEVIRALGTADGWALRRIDGWMLGTKLDRAEGTEDR